MENILAEKSSNTTSFWRRTFCTVTPVSKLWAAVLFITMPFLGFFFGMHVAVTNEPMTYSVAKSEPVLQEDSAVSELVKESLPNGIDAIANGCWGEPLIAEEGYPSLQPEKFRFISYGVEYRDVESCRAVNGGYMIILLETVGEIFLTHWFSGKGVATHGLYKYEKATNSMQVMLTSEHFNSANGDDTLSPDKRKIAVIKDSAFGTRTVGYIDLLTDTYTELWKVPEDEPYVVCEEVMAGCWGEIVWTSNSSFKVTLYDKSSEIGPLPAMSSKEFSI